MSLPTHPLGIVKLGTKHLAGAATSCVLSKPSSSGPMMPSSSQSLSGPGVKLASQVKDWNISQWARTFSDLERQQLASAKFTKLTKQVGADVLNASANRYPNVLPYDHTRVTVTSKEIEGEIYINANHVKVSQANRHYILTQGPLDQLENSTIDEFWMMAFQQKSNTVVMLCRCEEPNGYNRLVQKSAKYWPEKVGDTLVLGEMTGGLEVTMTESSLDKDHRLEDNSNHRGTEDNSDLKDYVRRTFVLTDTSSGDKRTIRHFHYVSWPDFDVPDSPNLFIDFLLDVRGAGCFSQSAGPPIFHCSAGIGRSGTLGLVDSCLMLAETGVELSLATVLDTLRTMRGQRSGCVQTENQLRFGVEAIQLGLDRMGLTKVPSHKRLNSWEGEGGEGAAKKRKNVQS